jgi:hypothetical protein
MKGRITRNAAPKGGASRSRSVRFDVPRAGESCTGWRIFAQAPNGARSQLACGLLSLPSHELSKQRYGEIKVAVVCAVDHTLADDVSSSRAKR